jgi:hypothetical protein
VNVRQIAAQSAGGAESNSSSELPNHPTELQKGMGSPQSDIPPPTPPSTPIVNAHPGAGGWNGLNHRDQRLAANGQQFSLEPPDQGLCQGFGFVMESVNDALMIFNTKGIVQLPAPISLSQFYGLPNPITRPDPLGGGGPPFGPFLSDPKCYWDPDGQHWYASTLEIDVHSNSGTFAQGGATLLAVSQTRNPLDGWNIYIIDATDASHPHCPCFGDQPLIGADHFGFYVETAEYDLLPFGGHANFGQIYAIDKSALESGSPAFFVHYSGLPDTHTATIQPSTSPVGDYDLSNGGTEYFMSGRDCLPPACAIAAGQHNKIEVWALTDTSSLSSGGTPTLSMTSLAVDRYGQPAPMTQKPGPTPLANALGEPLEFLNPNDVRMNQVVYANGYLWSGINTIADPGPRTAIEWFIVRPMAMAGSISATVANQGYIAVDANHVAFPSIGVNASGSGVVAFTLVGPHYFPSAAYATISLAGAGDVHILAPGYRPDDGFTGYPEYGGADHVARWGDYSAAVAQSDGRIWLGVEYISSDPRTSLANWGTFVGRVEPSALPGP